jgi:hypothetical protein
VLVHLPDPLARSRPLALAGAGLTALAVAGAALAWPTDGPDLSAHHLWWIALGSITVMVTLVARTGIWSAAGAYAVVFWCFHFGLVAVLGSGLVEPMQLSLWDQLWLLGPYGADAAFLALIGFAAYAVGAVLVSEWYAPAGADAPSEGPDNAVHAYGQAGSMVVLASVALWCVIVAGTAGVRGFLGSYGDYLNATDQFGPLLALVWLGAGCGLVVSVTGAAGWLRTTALIAFGCLAIVALPLGLRGEIMFPTVAALVAAHRRGWTLSRRRAVAFAAVLVLVIPLVREVRTTGVQGLPNLVVDLRLFDAFVEMGSSLHPVEKVVRWRAEGEALQMGGSYWAPIERGVARLLPGVRAQSADDDMRIMNVLVMDRIGAIGFSPVAEAYRNFGALGVLGVLALLGAGLAGIDRVADRRRAVLMIATLYVPLLINVRNSFISVPAQCAAGLLLIACLAAVRHVSASIICNPYARAPYVGREV